jgi:hypothetical protein
MLRKNFQKETDMADPTNINTLKLGKLPPQEDSRRLRLANYIDFLPAPPPSANWYGNVSQFGMMLNDVLGDCTCAMMGHGVQVARLNSPSGLVTPPDSDIEALYEGACGYVPGDPATDQGGVIVDVLNYARQNAPWAKKKRPGRGGHKHPYELLAYADPDPLDATHVKQAIAAMGTVGIGLQLPLTAQAQTFTGVWDVVGDPNTDPNSQPGSWGGHAVIVAAYDSDTLTAMTWGALQPMTWRFWQTYVDESHCLLYKAWVEQFGAPYTAMLAKLDSDLAAVSG